MTATPDGGIEITIMTTRCPTLLILIVQQHCCNVTVMVTMQRQMELHSYGARQMLHYDGNTPEVAARRRWQANVLQDNVISKKNVSDLLRIRSEVWKAIKILQLQIFFSKQRFF